MSAEVKQRDFVVFFSWQSDLPAETTTNVIRECLRYASTFLEAKYVAEKLHIILDEATRGKAGSPNIPQTIMDKIQGADVFLSDITTINPSHVAGVRPVPNPNVAIELGFAIAQLGWDRILMLFNEGHGGNFPGDMPFDVDRHRASPFTFNLPLPDEDKLTKKQKKERLDALKSPLRDLLVAALEAILKQNPPRPSDLHELSPENRKSQRDFVTIRELLSILHLPTIDEFLDEIQLGQIPHDSLHFWESFNGLATSRLFHLYDGVAARWVKELHDSWGGCLGLDQHFHPNIASSKYLFRGVNGMPFDEEQQRDWNKLQEFGRRARTALDAFLAHVRENYVEIDIDKASAVAWRDYVRFLKEL